MAWIYLIENLVNNKKYVGFTSYTPEMRFNAHLKGSSSPLLNKAIKKYGASSFQMTPLYYGFDDHHTLFTMEEVFIRENNSHYKDGYGYNMSYGGTSNNRGKVYPKEVRERMSLSRLGKKRPSSGLNISKALTGRSITKEWRTKISTTLSGRTLPEETRQKMKGKRGVHKNPRTILCSCFLCKKTMDIRGLHNHFKSHPTKP